MVHVCLSGKCGSLAHRAVLHTFGSVSDPDGTLCHSGCEWMCRLPLWRLPEKKIGKVYIASFTFTLTLKQFNFMNKSYI